jgi:hypothetical protein
MSGTVKGQTQTIQYTDALNEIGAMWNAVLNGQFTYLSFQTMIYYSTESNPTTYLDSLPAIFKLAGPGRYTKIGNTETIQNLTQIVYLYNDDSTLITSPVVIDSLSPYPSAAGQEFILNNLDSNFIMANVDSMTVSIQNGVKSLEFYFNDSCRYYNCIAKYNPTTYMPISFSYILRSSKATETGEMNGDGAIVTMVFSNFSTAAFDTTPLNTWTYIYIGSDGKAGPQPAYGAYTFIQTANFPTGN